MFRKSFCWFRFRYVHSARRDLSRPRLGLEPSVFDPKGRGQPFWRPKCTGPSTLYSQTMSKRQSHHAAGPPLPKSRKVQRTPFKPGDAAPEDVAEFGELIFFNMDRQRADAFSARLRKQHPMLRAKRVFRREFEALQRMSDPSRFHSWYMEHREDVLANQDMIAGSVRLLSQVEGDVVEEVYELAKNYPQHLNEAVCWHLMEKYGANGDLEKCLEVYENMKRQGIRAKGRTCGALLKILGKRGTLECFKKLEEVYVEIRNELLVDPRTSFLEAGFLCSYLEARNAFVEQNQGKDVGQEAAAESLNVLSEALKYITVPDSETLAVVRDTLEVAPGKWKMVSGCRVDSASCKCENCGQELESIETHSRTRESFAERLRNLVEDSIKSEAAAEQWGAFKAFIDRNGHKYDCVIDAANVAYFKQNFAHGGFAIGQVKAIVDHLERGGLRPLVVMHVSHMSPRDLRTTRHQQMVQGWIDEEKLFLVPRGMNDDLFWLYASAKLSPRLKFVSNDQCRDHHFNLLSEVDFTFWKERLQAKFDFYRDNASSDEVSSISVVFPSRFSKRSQGDAEKGFHFPVLESIEWPNDEDVFHDADSKTVQQLRLLNGASQTPDLKWICASRQ